MSKPQRSFWAHPWTKQIIGGAMAAILAALVIATWKGAFSSLTSHTGHTLGPSATPNTPGPVPSPKVAVRWQGPISINSSGVDLDALPPSTIDNNQTFYEDAGGRLAIYSGTEAEWTGSSNPTYSQCHNLVLTQGGGDAPQLTSGLQVCDITGGGHTAYVHVMSQSANGWGAQAIVWNQ